MTNGMWEWERSPFNTYYRDDKHYGRLFVTLSDFNGHWWLYSTRNRVIRDRKIYVCLGEDVYGIEAPPLYMADSILYALGCRPDDDGILSF